MSLGRLKTLLVNNMSWILLGVSVIVIIILLLFSHHPVRVIKADNSDILKQVEYYKDKNDKNYAKIDQLIISKEEAEKRADSLARALKLKPKQVKGEDVYVYSTDTVFTDLPVRDTLYLGDSAYKVEKKDGWVDITAVAGKNGGSIDYSSKDTLYRLDTYKNPLIGRVKHTTIVRNTNPYNRIQQGYSWKVEEKQDIITIGPYVGYDFLNRSPSIGISLQFPIFHIRK